MIEGSLSLEWSNSMGGEQTNTSAEGGLGANKLLHFKHLGCITAVIAILNLKAFDLFFLEACRPTWDVV